MAGAYSKNGPSKTNWKLFDWIPMGTRPVGRPRQQWQENVMKGLKMMKDKTWNVIAKVTRTGRDLAEKAKAHKGL